MVQKDNVYLKPSLLKPDFFSFTVVTVAQPVIIKKNGIKISKYNFYF